MIKLAEIIRSKIQSNILSLDATALAKCIRERKLTSEEITATFIDHIKEINPIINAVTEERFEEAIEEAIQKDLNIDTNLFGKPLYGVPISMKESFNVAGMKTTGGIIHRQDLIKSKDAQIVKILKDAGAIILCKTNTPPLCFCQETDNKLYGRTNNPWNIKHTASGSSGGEGALISAGGTALGFGSDIGGSIRFPSHFNGVIGFKSGSNDICSDGHFPPTAHELQDRMLGCGAISKSIRDAELIHDLILGTNKKRNLFEKVQIEVLDIENEFPLCTESKSILNDVTTFLQQEYDIDHTIPPYFNDSALIWQELMSIDGGNHLKRIAFNTDRPNLWRTYLREKMFNNTETHQNLSWALIGTKLFKPSKKRISNIEQLLKTGDKTLSGYLNNRVLIFPVYHSSAPKHGELYKEIFSINKTFLNYMPYTAYANVWGLPALTIPIRSDSNNLPIGIQLMSKVGNENSIFKIGKKIEKEFGGYTRSMIDPNDFE